MFLIGEFAALTGLSVKALRHYDEKGVLVPDAVDAHSGYRRYGEGQVRDGAVIRALREAEVPLAAVTTDVGAALEALAAHRAEVLEYRAREDAAFADAASALRAYAVPVEVERRQCPAQPFVARIISVSVDEADSLTDDDANEAFAELFRRLQRDGHTPSGPFFTTMRADGHDRIALECCWPVASAMPEGWGGPGMRCGVLPPRTELVATWRATAGEALPEGATHPAIVALFERVAESDVAVGPAEVRQRVIGGANDAYDVEVSITVGE